MFQDWTRWDAFREAASCMPSKLASKALPALGPVGILQFVFQRKLVEVIRPVDLPIRRGDRHVSFAITQKLKRLVEGSLGRVAREARNPERGA